MTIMYDGINTDAAAIHAHAPTAPVACYINGLFAWSPAQEHLFARKIRISVMAGQPDAAKNARVLDVERGDAGPGDVVPFLKVRNGIAPNGTIYCSLATVPAVLAQLQGRRTRWWLAWYWGRPGAPSAAAVLAQLKAETGETIPAADLWACQYVSRAQWDESIIYGVKDFSR